MILFENLLLLFFGAEVKVMGLIEAVKGIEIADRTYLGGRY